MTRPTDQDLDQSVAVVLRIGVTLSAAVVIVGAILMRHQLFSPVPDYTHFHPGNPELRSIARIIRGALRFTPNSMVQLGLLLLIVTPVARVVLCVVGFARQRDLLYIAVSTLVLLVLILSFVRAGQ
jgi:uncharacterized membrane protein